MSSVIIAGDTSGTVTLQAPSAAGSTVINLPTVSGGSFVVSDSSGNVGIGTSSPSYVLDAAVSSGSAALNLTSSGTGGCNLLLQATRSGVAVLGVGSAVGALAFATGTGSGASATERIRIDSNGNVGIGASSPATLLHLKSASSGAPQLRIEGTGADNGIITWLGNGHANPAVGIRYISTGDSIGNLAFYANGTSSSTLTERMRIDSSGYLFVNTTTKVGIGGANRANFYDASNNVVSALAGASGAAAFQGSVASTSGYLAYWAYYNGSTYTNTGAITTNGTTTTYGTTSDYRLKENIAPMTGALEKVSALKPCTYIWKADGSSGQGFIAHELQDVIPDAVTGEKDGVETYFDEEGNEQTRNKFQNIDTSFLVATLTAAIQELNAKFEAYKEAHP